MILPELEVGDVLYRKGTARYAVHSVKRGKKLDEPVYMLRGLETGVVFGPFPGEYLSGEGYYVMERQQTEATKHVYIFKYKDSDQEVLRTTASSQAQAIHQAGIRKGHDWIQDAIETGLILIDVEKPKEKKDSPDVGPSCPNCKKRNSKTIATGETMCRECGWIWDTRDESISQLIKTVSGNTDAKPMLKKWKQQLGKMIPMDKEVDEAIALLLQ